MKRTTIIFLFLLIALSINLLSYSTGDLCLRRARSTTTNEWVDPTYLEQYFVTPQMQEMLSDYNDWLKGSSSPLSWMKFIRDVALNEIKYNLTHSKAARTRATKAINALIKEVEKVGESKWIQSTPDAEKFLIVEKIIQQNRIEEDSSKLLLFRALSPGFRKWSWEDLAVSGSPDLTAKMTDFMDKLQVLYLDDYSLENRIAGVWELKWIYTNKNLPQEIRTRALEGIFNILNTRVQDLDTGGFLNAEVLWRNAREVLRELFSAQRWSGIDIEADEEIWRPVLERALVAIENANNFGIDSNYAQTSDLFSTDQEFWSWWAITDALSSISFDDNPDLMEEIARSNSSEAIRHVLPSSLAYVKPTLYSDRRDELIAYLKDRFLEAEGDVWIESLGETILKIGSPKIVEELLAAGFDQSVDFEKRRWALRTVGETYYRDVDLLNKMRDEIFRAALYIEGNTKEEGSKLRNAALGSIFALRRHLEERGVEFISPDIDISSYTREDYENALVKLVPTEGETKEFFMTELERITSRNFNNSEDAVKEYMALGTPKVYQSVIEALVASVGAGKVTEALINFDDIKGSIDIVETLTATPFEYLIGYMWIRQDIGNYEWVEPKLNAEFNEDGILVVDGVQYSENLGYPRDIDRPMEIFRAEDGSLMMLKHGDELGIVSEYISQQIYAQFIREEWGEDGGIGVSPLGLLLDPRDGRIKLATAMVPGYSKGTKFLQPQYIHDERMQSLIAPALVLGDGSRTPKGFLFFRRDFEQTMAEYDAQPDYLLFNIAGLLASGGMGFKPFGNHFEVTDSFDEFSVLTHSSHTGMSGSYSNEAWGQVINGTEQELLDDYLMNLELLKDDTTRMVYVIMNEVSNLLGYRFGERYTVQDWQNQITAENEFGRWSLGKKRTRNMLESMFNGISREGSLRVYLTSSLASRINEAMQYLGYILRRVR
ncbi:MAG: hypothetical protein P9L98_02315 [Candidatus Kaelpia imicola]|nr:hypothetical protein [Candidatus Kaelpia imicola]